MNRLLTTLVRGALVALLALGAAVSSGADIVAGGTQWRGARPVPVATTADMPETSGLPARRMGSTVIERQEVIVQAHTDVFSYRQVMDEMSWHGAA